MSTAPTKRRLPPRDAQGHFTKRGSRDGSRAAILSIGGVMLAAGAAVGAALWQGWLKLPGGDDGEHAAPDLAADAPPVGSERAPDAFRPDPTAPVPAGERESLRPATGPAPSLVEDRGSMRSQTAPANA